MLVMRVRALLRRVNMGKSSKADQPAELAMGDVRLVESSHEASVGNRPLALTMNEFALLKCLLAARGSAVSRDTLLKDVWGIDAEVETRVTDECVRRVRKKLRDAGSNVAIKAVWGFGYKLEVADA